MNTRIYKRKGVAILLAIALVFALLPGYATSTQAAPANTVVSVDITESFTDPGFREAVYNVIDKSAPEPIYNTDVVGISELNVSSLGIRNLSGLTYFTGLESLNCAYNRITELPPLPEGLRYLSCTENQLTSLPDLPDSLIEISCNTNPLTYLPELPDALAFLNCSNSQLLSLPALPDSLTKLECFTNQLTFLPALPASLTSLSCSNNGLTSLPALPDSLSYLSCGWNPLTSLPPLPNSLATLNCDGNGLTSLPALPAGLTSLSCFTNLLSALDVSGLNLSFLDCKFNNMTNESKVLGFTGEWDDVSYIFHPQNDSLPEPILTSITIAAPPARTTWAEGEALDLTGLSVLANYDDGSEIPVTDFAANPAAGATLTPADTKVIITWRGKTAEFPITVNQVQPAEPKLIVSATEGGSIIRLPLFNLGLKAGSTVTVYAFPQPGYKLANWYTTGFDWDIPFSLAPGQLPNPLKFAMRDRDVTVKAVFEKLDLCKITTSTEGLGLLLGGSATAYEGATVTLLAVPLWPFSRLDHWEVNGANAGTSLILNHTVSGDVTIKAVFK